MSESDCHVQVSELEHLQFMAAEKLASFLQSDSVLTQVSHASRLQDDPDWALVVGLGYCGSQKQSLIYKHLAKLLTHLRAITGGDALKGKALSEMLFLRAHAGMHMCPPRASLARLRWDASSPLLPFPITHFRRATSKRQCVQNCRASKRYRRGHRYIDTQIRPCAP